MKKNMFTLVLGCFFASFVQAGVVAYWTFDEKDPGTQATLGETVLDTSGNGINLEVTAKSDPNMTFVEGNPDYNPFGSAVYFFPPSTGQVLIPAAGGPSFDLGVDYTIECLIWLAGPITTENGFLAKRGLPGEYWYRFDEPNGRPNFLAREYVKDGEVLNSGGKVASENGIGAEQWTHVAWVRDSVTEEYRVYLDGELVLTEHDELAGVSYENDGSVHPVQIGAMDPDYDSAAKRFHGKIDFIKVSDEALSVEEFVQPIGKPSDPDPASNSVMVPIDKVFGWSSIEGQNIISETVNLSDTEDMSNVLESAVADGNSISFSNLQKGQTYYWRVDTLIDFGDDGTTIIEGDVWSFNTPSCVITTEEGDLDGNCSVDMLDFSILAENWLRSNEYE
ncbi:hypothetical protein L21SP3_00916 [Sedimentisphaera cyanobacteriorum]|uniref:LamG-like jellyroll fold domain-containing protein n=1 Tax=Sedimentisphaera cyanobacteriorum TaxID=1940790 RepID=A0A1Q2HPB5_9BACT|nr:LamG-like jellyroll fold domain-containing protein [Sedimentisphaera cyanobacteriorum]AQQ09116.1 hypothetical protein L21SP3_00916 [Sedimentisphaera cyanobacteriorum]